MSDLYFELKEGMYQTINENNISNPKQMYEMTIQKNYFNDNEVEVLKEISRDLDNANNMVKKRIKKIERK